jgi:hypothetical protein
MTAEQGAGLAPQLIAEELRRRRIHVLWHGTPTLDSLEQHLFNTSYILAAWKLSPRVQYAGLVHSVYSTDVFKHRTFSMDERDRVRALVGEESEQLAYLFCVTDRRELLSVVRASANDTVGGFELANRLDGHRIHVNSADAGDLLAIHMANTAEQRCEPDRSPARWLSRVSLVGREVRRLADVAPAVFDGCTTVVSDTEETQLLAEYQRLVAGFGSADDGADDLDQRCIDWPLVAEPLVWVGLGEIARGALDRPSDLGQAAAARMRLWGTPWDKRLSLRQWLQLCAALCDETKADELGYVARRIAAAAESVPASPERLYMELARAELLPDVAGAGIQTSGRTGPITVGDNASPSAGADANGHLGLPTRFQTYIAGLRTNHKRPRMTRYPGLRSMPWHDPQQFQLARDLEAVADKVAAEVHAFDVSGFQDEAEKIDRSGQWSVLFLYERGRKNEHNCSLCPETVAVIEANRTVRTLGGLAYFSRLEPGTRIAPHTGPTNMRLRCHLGIDVPEDCGLRVGGIERTWQEGRCLVFDDSHTHEAWNDSDRSRVVLVVDLWHPDLTDDEVALLNGLHRYATATGVRLARYWENNRTKNPDASRGESPPGTSAPASTEQSAGSPG